MEKAVGGSASNVIVSNNNGITADNVSGSQVNVSTTSGCITVQPSAVTGNNSVVVNAAGNVVLHSCSIHSGTSACIIAGASITNPCNQGNNVCATQVGLHGGNCVSNVNTDARAVER